MGKRGKAAKVESFYPVDWNFWDQFSRDFGMGKGIYNLYSEFRWVTYIADIARRLLYYLEIVRKDGHEDQEDKVSKSVRNVTNMIPECLRDLDYWMFHCLEAPIVYDGIAQLDSLGRPIMRDIGFYQLKRQNILPVGTEMYVLVEGFTTPLRNEDYNTMKMYALYGDPTSDDKDEKGIKGVVLKIESIFHRVLDLQREQPFDMQPETLLMGNEPEVSDISQEQEEIAEIAQMMRALNEQTAALGEEDNEDEETDEKEKEK